MENDYYHRSNQTPELKIVSMISSVWVSRIIYFGVKRNLFNIIKQTTVSAEELSSATNIDKTILLRILQGYVHLNLIKADLSRPLQLTELGDLLSLDAEKNFHHMALLWGEEFHNAWDKGLNTLENNTPGFDHHYGKNIFAYLGEKPAVANSFDHAMCSLAQFIYPKVADFIKLSSEDKVTDVGGGNGFLLTSILNVNPQAQGLLYEQEHVIQRIEKNSKLNIQYESGDFFQSIPASSVHVLANILHDWNDSQALTILKNVRAAKKPAESLYIVEMLLDHQDEPHLARSTDLNMLLLTGGRERTRAEMESLLNQSQFAIQEVKNINQMTCVIRATAI